MLIIIGSTNITIISIIVIIIIMIALLKNRFLLYQAEGPIRICEDGNRALRRDAGEWIQRFGLYTGKPFNLCFQVSMYIYIYVCVCLYVYIVAKYVHTCCLSIRSGMYVHVYI